MKRDKQYYRDLDQSQIENAKLQLENAIGQLKIAVNQRSDWGKKLMDNGDRAGTGNLYNMLEKLENMRDSWDEETKLYGC